MNQEKGGRRDADSALPPALEAERRLTLAEVSALTGLGRTSIYKFVAAGLLPQPERRGTRCSRWRAADVLAALKATSPSVSA